jgi:hypothetical protein
VVILYLIHNGGGTIMKRVIILLGIICGSFMLLSCSYNPSITKATVTSWQQNRGQLTINYRFSNLGSSSLSSYWIRFEIKASDNSTQYYTHEKTQTVNGGSVISDSVTTPNLYTGLTITNVSVVTTGGNKI